MDMNPVGWFEIYVADIDRAAKFYQEVLKVELTDLPSPVAEMEGQFKMKAFPMNPEAAGATGALIQMEGIPVGSNSVLVYFSCQDCAEEASRVEAAGGKVCKPKFSIGPHGFIALASDTEGNMFGLHSRE